MDLATLSVGLIGAVAGFFLQALSAYLNDKRAERRQRRQWMRDKAFEALEQWNEIADEIIQAYEKRQPISSDQDRRFRHIGMRLGLVTPGQMWKEVVDLNLTKIDRIVFGAPPDDDEFESTLYDLGRYASTVSASVAASIGMGGTRLRATIGRRVGPTLAEIVDIHMSDEPKRRKERHQRARARAEKMYEGSKRKKARENPSEPV